MERTGTKKTERGRRKWGAKDEEMTRVTFPTSLIVERIKKKREREYGKEMIKMRWVSN